MNNFRLLPVLLLLLAGANSGPAGTIVRFQTTVGDFDVELFDADKPVTVKNFLRYVQGGYYTNMFMHRVVPNFVIQGGGYNVIGLGTPNPGVQPVTAFAPIPNEINVGKFYSNVYGTIAMAKLSDPNSATSEFFFNLANNSATLDDPNNSGGFTVFGHVITGTNVLNEFNVGTNNLTVKWANLGGVYSQLPLLYSANLNNVTFDDLIYVNVGTPPKYAPLKATYNGLFFLPGSAARQVAGVVTVATTASQKFTGSLRLGAARYAFSGSFDTNGYAKVTATSKNLAPLVVNLNTDAALGTDKLVGSISSSAWVAGLSAYRAVFSSGSSPATAYAGKYTLFLPENLPGQGFAAVSVDLGGKVQIKGSLADGTAFSQTGPVSRDGRFPLYVPVARGSGSVSGWMSFVARPDDAVNATLLWLQSAQPTNGSFAGAPAYQTTGVGGRYNPPTGGTPVLSLTNCSVTFSGGGLTASFTNILTLKGNRLANTSANKLTMALTLSSGLFSGSVKPPGSSLSIPFKGALWQKRNSGYGYFHNAGQGGAVVLAP